jgi:hypothetical protein
MIDPRKPKPAETPKNPSSEDKRASESRHILASVNDEMQISGLGNNSSNRFANRVTNHFAARDADPADKIEVLGRRIGRVLSLALCLGLIVWLALFIMGNAS